jgi:hypothetical protein
VRRASGRRPGQSLPLALAALLPAAPVPAQQVLEPITVTVTAPRLETPLSDLPARPWT